MLRVYIKKEVVNVDEVKKRDKKISPIREYLNYLHFKLIQDHKKYATLKRILFNQCFISVLPI